MHLYCHGLHAKYVPSINKLIQLNNKSSFIYKRARGEHIPLQSSHLVCIERNKLLLLSSRTDKINRLNTYLCIIDNKDNKKYEWKECEFKLPKPLCLDRYSPVIVAFEHILIIFETYPDIIWFCDLNSFDSNKKYEWIKTEFIENYLALWMVL